MKEFLPEQLKKWSSTLPKVGLNFDNFELWMTVMSAVESADQSDHMHYSQPIKIKFGTNNFLEFYNLVLLWYRERVKHYR